jgi:hypothetical protein
VSNTRPSVQRKHTRASEQKRADALDEGIRIVLAGTAYEVRAGDLTAMDSLACRQQTGMPFAGILEAFGTAPDIDLVAAVMWLARRVKGERTLSFEAVASELRYGDVLDIEVEDVGPEEVGADPEV